MAGLIDTLRYQRGLSHQIGQTLNHLTGQELPPDWFAWVEWAGQHPEIESFAGYPAWKANLFAQIDPNFRRFVHADMKVAPDSRVEEIVWGGVRVDGIPALDNPTMIVDRTWRRKSHRMAIASRPPYSAVFCTSVIDRLINMDWSYATSSLVSLGSVC